MGMQLLIGMNSNSSLIPNKMAVLPPKKRLREPVDIITQIISMAKDGWQNSISLSLHVWKLRVDLDSTDIIETFRRLAAVVQEEDRAVLRYKIRILGACDGVPVVYVSPLVNINTIAEEYASRVFRHAHKPQTVLPISSPSGHRTMRALVVDRLPSADRTVAFEVLMNHWIDTRALQTWQDIVWRKITDRRTHNVVDVATTLPADHPIWPLLLSWLAVAVSDPVVRMAPPEFPVPRDLDPRRAPTVPDGFGALSLDAVWRGFEGTVAHTVLVEHKLKFALGHGLGKDSATTVHPERIAFWQQLASGRVWFTFAELVTMFGWHVIRCDAQLVYLLSRALLAEAPVATWCNQSSKPQTYCPSGLGCTAIHALRSSAIIITCFTSAGMTPKQKTQMTFDLRAKTQALDA